MTYFDFAQSTYIVTLIIRQIKFVHRSVVVWLEYFDSLTNVLQKTTLINRWPVSHIQFAHPIKKNQVIYKWRYKLKLKNLIVCVLNIDSQFNEISIHLIFATWDCVKKLKTWLGVKQDLNQIKSLEKPTCRFFALIVTSQPRLHMLLHKIK